MAKALIESTLIAVAAEIAPHINRIMELHVPPILMESFQCIAWLSAGVIAWVSVVKHYRRIKSEKKNGN